MCTVFAMPTPDGGYVLAGNRDERLYRPKALPPSLQRRGDRRWLAPRDPEGGGTWTSVNDLGLGLSLLNNYSVAMVEPDAPISRGQLVDGLADAGNLDEVLDRLQRPLWELPRVRPFTLVAVLSGGPDRPATARTIDWDGHELVWVHNELPAMWTSNGADQQMAERVRAPAWKALVDRYNPAMDPLESILIAARDHQPEAGRLSICMHARPFASTVSHSAITVGTDGVAIRYLEGSPCRGSLGPPLRLSTGHPGSDS